MWFKNARLYCLTRELDITPEVLEEKLAAEGFAPCGGHDKSSLGWVSPLGREGEMLTHTVGRFTMICAQYQERLLPASVIRDVTDERVAALEERQGRKVYRRERREIQDDVFATLLPRAFVRNLQLHAYLVLQDRLLVINTTSAPRAEALLNLLRECLGSLPVALPEVKRAPSELMTRWLKERKATDKFVLEQECELYNPLDAANVVRCKGQDLHGDELKSHLAAGKRVRSLGVSWNSVVSAVIDEDLMIKRLRFEGMREETANEEVESEVQKFDQEFALMTLELAGFFQSLFKAFGGLVSRD